MTQVWTGLDIAGAEVFGALLVFALLWMVVEWLRAAKRVPPSLYAGPAQDDADRLVQRRFETRVAANRTAQRAAQAIEHWHADPRSDGRLAQVIQFPQESRHVR